MMNRAKILEKFKDKKVLVVEDSDDIRELIDNTFKMFVSHIDCASNGKEGIEKFQNSKPDIVLTDIRMPVLNGNKMAVELKKIDPNIPIIIISAYTEELDSEDYVDACFNKPIKFPELLVKMDELL